MKNLAKFIILILLITGTPVNLNTYSPNVHASPTGVTFQTVKSRLKKVYRTMDDPRLLYSNARIDKESFLPIIEGSGYYFRAKGSEVNIKSRLGIDFDHIAVSKQMEDHNGCPEEVNREHCARINLKFKNCFTDPYNLFPTIASINRYRGDMLLTVVDGFNYKPFGKIINIKKALNSRYIEPDTRAKGQVARAYLHMHNRDCITLNPIVYILYSKWNNEFPIKEQEQFKNDLIKKYGYEVHPLSY